MAIKRIFHCFLLSNITALICIVILQQTQKIADQNPYNSNNQVKNQNEFYEDDVAIPKNNRSLFLLGESRLEPEWSGTRIFGHDASFITMGLPEDSSFFDADLMDSKMLFERRHISIQSCSTTKAAGLGYLNSENCQKTDRILFKRAGTTHFYLKFNTTGVSILVAKLFLVSTRTKPYYFCYGLPSQFLAGSNVNFSKNKSATCPPCVCASVFSGLTLSRKLDISDEFISPRLLLTGQRDMAFYLWTRTANQLLKHSRFVPCLGMNAGNWDEEATISSTFSSAWAVRELFLRHRMQIALQGKTLLNWYRNCSIQEGGSDDLEFFVPSWALNRKFYQRIIHSAYVKNKPLSYKMTRNDNKTTLSIETNRVLGDLVLGAEIRFDVKNEADGRKLSEVDVFTFYLDWQTDWGYYYLVGFGNRGKTIFHYEIPKNGSTLCSTLFLGDLYLVPCQPDAFLEAAYGTNWRSVNFGLLESDVDGFNAYKAPNIVRSIALTRKEWRRRVMFKSFERSNIFQSLMSWLQQEFTSFNNKTTSSS